MMAAAVAGPIPGSVSSSAALAVLTSTGLLAPAASVAGATWLCPAGVDASTTDVAVLTQACQDIKFSGFALVDSALEDLGSGATDSETGKIAFEHIPAGQVFVSQGPILGYIVLPVVFCDRYTA